MRSIILSVGTELLFGQITNTNSVYLSQQLNALGIDVMYHFTVGDNPKRVEETLKLALENSDIVITTGGLGPTQDDLTKEIVAKVMENELVLHKQSLEHIEHFFNRLKRVMTDNNIKQAYLPERAIVFENDAGTAPGFALESKGKIVVCLPGPPREMTHMFQKKVLSYLEKKSNSVIHYKMIRLFGIGESALEDALKDIISSQTDPTIATYAKEGEVAIRVTSKRKNRKEADEAVSDMIEKIRERIGEFIYSFEDEDLVHVVAKKLIERNISFSCAESCTGGLFAASLTEIPGISSVFDRGIVTYSNHAKIEELNVSEETIEKFGAVSFETALEMVEGLRAITDSRLCISVTGVAGPNGGTEEKPVGHVNMCAILDGEKVCNEYKVRAVNRNWNRNYTVLLMLNMINKLIRD